MSKPARSTFLMGLGGAALTACSSQSKPMLDAMLPNVKPHASAAVQIQRIIEYYVENSDRIGKKNIAIVVGVVHPGFGSTTFFFGGKPVAAQHHTRPIALNEDTPFEIGSITKTMASWVFGYAGKDYGATLSDYIKAKLPPGVASLNITNIANYSSGFPTDDVPPIWYADNFINATDLPALIATMKQRNKPLPQCAPGKFYSYSNFAWGLLGLAAVGVENPYTKALHRWKDAIANLRAHLSLSDRTKPADNSTASVIPAGYREGETVLLPENYSYLKSSWNTLFGGGDIVSTGRDLYAWLRYNMGIGGRDLALLEQQQRPHYQWLQQEPPAEPRTLDCPPPAVLKQPVGTAFGWFREVSTVNPNVTVMTKNGGEAGFTSWMGFTDWVNTGKPSSVGCIALVNSGGQAADVIGQAVMNVLLLN